MTEPAEGGPDEPRTFHHQRLRGAAFSECSLNDATFVECDLRGVRFSGVWFEDVEVDGYVRQLVVNGVDVGPFVESELDRRHPGRSTVKAVHGDDVDADGVREGWRVAADGWEATLARARAMPAESLHERVAGEWSFIETLRHLVFVVDAWLRRALLADPAPYHPLGLPHTEMGEIAGVPNDPSAHPGLPELEALVRGRFAEVTAYVAGLTDDSMAGEAHTPDAPGYPEADVHPVMRCLGAVVDETWEHRLIAERDLARLTPTPA